MSKTTSLHHIVFCTKNRKMTIPLQHKEDIYRWIWKRTTDLECTLLRIGGIQNHIHMLIDLHPNVALAQFLHAVKGVSSTWMRRDPRFPDFEGWADGYYASTISYDQRGPVIDYIKNQESHHLAVPFDDELNRLHAGSGLTPHPQDMM